MIHRSKFPDISLPDIAFAPFISERWSEYGDKPALIDAVSGRTLTYADLAQAVPRAAAGLAEHGFRQGEVLAILSPNIPEYAIAFHACVLIGGVVTTLNPIYTEQEIEHQLRDAGAKVLVTVPPLLQRALPAARAAGVREVFVFGEAPGATPFARLLSSTAAVPPALFDPRQQLLALPYSSGTTGLPKGVMLTHANVTANILQSELTDWGNAQDVYIAVLPFFHIYGLVLILNACLRVGATLVTLPRFEFAQFLQAMQDYGVTRAPLVPPIVLALAKQALVENYDLSKLRSIGCGAAPLGAEIMAACAERLNCTVRQGYGMTEASGVTHSCLTPLSKPIAGTVGVLVASTEAKIIDVETGAALPPGERGEILIRGPQIMLGYLNRPEASASSLDAEGWLHTGDIGYADAEGQFFVVDRLKELIKFKGYQVAPAEIEALLLTHPAIADVAVIPIPDDEAGEVPKAFVVRKGEIDAGEVVDFVAQRLAPYKKPRRVEFVAAIPKSPSGKILRRTLVAQERERSTG
jgi:acyl-CoA synthetase (AMP-forming)/AMP-acid ligase II